MRILGIDPGLARTGFGLIEFQQGSSARFLDAGCITTPAGETLSDRLVLLAEDIETLLNDSQPDVVALEELYFGTNVTTGLAVAHARGVLLLHIAQHKIPVAVYAPSSVKLAVATSGRADKRQMQEMVKHILHLSTVPQPDDAADALALALCHTSQIHRLPSAL